jgi:hypothetical protein
VNDEDRNLDTVPSDAFDHLADQDGRDPPLRASVVGDNHLVAVSRVLDPSHRVDQQLPMRPSPTHLVRAVTVVDTMPSQRLRHLPRLSSTSRHVTSRASPGSSQRQERLAPGLPAALWRWHVAR